MKITITNEQDYIEIDKESIRKVIKLLPGMKKNFRLSLVYVDDVEIAKLNERYLKHQGPTDVLAFPIDSDEGEIIISGETALREATERKIEPKGELMLYTIHGTLHLLGYDDKTEEEANQMHDIEKKMILELGYQWDWD